jgi:hypothetical protein
MILTERDCRVHEINCVTIATGPHISIPLATILLAMGKTWSSLADQTERYDAVVREECDLAARGPGPGVGARGVDAMRNGASH